ncbi:MAG: hypothetical protein LBV09_00260 [Deferribacteraceae bacterium]|jgi:hypothetical protein|nr:hypothetical protein [Deferribacteraceae bacterium]
MQYDIRLIKLVSSETVMGHFNATTNTLEDVVIIQAMPTASGSVQLAMLPFGFPYEEEIHAKIEARHFLYEYKNTPEELKNKYIEAKSSIKIAPSGGGSGLIL